MPLRIKTIKELLLNKNYELSTTGRDIVRKNLNYKKD